LVPTVGTYASSYSFKTKRRIREVLPTPLSPTSTSFVLIRRRVVIGIRDGLHIRASAIRGFVGAYQLRFTFIDAAASPAAGDPVARIRSHTDTFCLPRIKISTNVDAFIPLAKKPCLMRLRPEGPRIAVPTWLIEWSKSRDLFLTLAHDPWVFRPN
jgi:hypothetical protein